MMKENHEFLINLQRIKAESNYKDLTLQRGILY